jgi:hypothetical protein
MPIREGAYWDIGTSASLAEAMEALRSRRRELPSTI